MNKTSNPNGEALYKVLADRKGEILTFAELANIAGVEAKTGYLTAAKKIARDNHQEIVKVEEGVIAKAHTVTTYPSGLEVESDREIKLAGYQLTSANHSESSDQE